MQTGRRVAIAVALATFVTLGLANCGQKKTAVTPKVAMVITASKLDFAKEMGDGFTAGSNEVGGVDATVVGLDIRGGPAQLTRFQELTRTAKEGIAVAT